MATFSAQIVSLVGGTPTQSELDVWCIEGAKEIVKQLTGDLQKKCASMQSFTSAAANSEAETLGEGSILSVFAGSVSCRNIPNTDKYKAEDSGDVSYATSTDPVYYFEADKINVLPSGLSCKYEEVQYPTVDADSDSSISNFPDEAEYLVVLYAATKQLLNYQSDMSSSFNTSIGTALSAIATEIGLAKAEVAEIVTQTDNSSDFATALTAMNTELDKVDDIIVEASAEFDEAKNLTAAYNSGQIATALDAIQANVDLANSVIDSPPVPPDSVSDTISDFAMGSEVTDALANAAKALDDGANSTVIGNASYDTATLIAAEDTELVASVLSIAGTELNRAGIELNKSLTTFNTDLQKFQASGLGKFSAEVAEYQAEIGEMSSRAQGYISAAQGYVSEIQAYATASNTFIATGNAYITEAQGYLSQAGGYAQEVTARGGFTSAKFQAIQGYLQTAQGYGSEATARLQMDTTKYQWYGDQYAKLSADYMRGLAILKGGGGA